uniref:Uncharacterized protein n=1 Tax=Rhodopseudomonas palustris (strain DX-1) TaxID=652103 RepID=E6VJ69_RHOPX
MAKREMVVEGTEIHDRASLREWLERNPAAAPIIAVRCALRVLPLVARRSRATLSIQVFRATFVVCTSQRLGWYNKSPIRAAADAADADADADAAAADAAAAAAYAAAAAAAADAAAADAAAAAYAAAYAATDAAALWKSVTADAASLEKDGTVERLTWQRLWLSDVRGGDRRRLNIPDWARAAFDRFKRSDGARDAGFAFWIRWYEGVLAGRREGLFDSELTGESERDLFIRIAEQPDSFWKQEPAKVNADIRRLIDEAKAAKAPEAAPPKVPATQPAAIEPVWQEDGKLGLPRKPAAPDLDATSLLAALEALRDDIIELADDADNTANIDKRPAEYLRKLARLIPAEVPSQVLLFKLGHGHEVLADLASHTDSEWPDLLASRYRRLVLQYERVVRQFPKWREFVQNAATEKLTDEQIRDALQVAESFAAELRTGDGGQLVDAGVPAALEEIVGAAVDWRADLAAGSEQLAEDLLESVNNILKRLSEHALWLKAKAIASDMTSAYGKEARKSLVKEAGKLGKETGPAIGRLLKRIAKVTPFIGGGSAAGYHLLPKLVSQYPAYFGWLEPVLKSLGIL